MNRTFVVLLKDLLIRRNHWVMTGLEVLLPILIILLLNITQFEPGYPKDNGYMNDTIDKNCINLDLDTITSIYYEPTTNFTKTLMSEVKCLGGFANVKPGNMSEKGYTLGVKYHGLDGSSPEVLNYEIYLTKNYWKNPYELWQNTKLDDYNVGFITLKNFLKLQHAVNEAFLKLRNIETPNITFRNTNVTPEDNQVIAIVIMSAFFLGFSLMIPGIVGRIVQEKASGAKELMLIMGLKRYHLWISKFLDCLILFGLVQIIVVILLHIPLSNTSPVLKFLSPGWTFVYFMFSSLSIILFLFFLSCFFSNSTVAVFVGQFVWGMSFVIFFIVSQFSFKIQRYVWLSCCLLPHFSFFTGLSILLDFDNYGKSVKVWETLSRYPSYPTLGHIFIMIAVDVCLYMILTWYFDSILPGKYGIPQTPLFCFRKTYWFPQRVHHGASTNWKPAENPNYEPVSNRMSVGISMSNLSKEYRSAKKGNVLAVSGISIDFYSGEISSLLGHNGAGKTTVFSMLSGLTYATSGKIIVDGFDMALDTDKARESLGLCPQKDMLFDDLNAEQILCFYGMLKGMNRSQAITEAAEFIEKLKLNDVKRTRSILLSGGQKRKVSLAVALIGGSKIVLLDEPTSGLDPEIRREIWEILLESRGTRTILLTTHFMEEADAISDRIAIMDHGKIKCYGTPIYLKSKFGSGYVLSVVISSADKANEMKDFIKEYVATAELKCQNGLTVTYQLPEDEIDHFPQLLSALEALQNSNRINSYSISFSTFEEVFIRMRGTEDETDAIIDVKHSPYRRLECSDEVKKSEMNNNMLHFYQLYALLEKKFIYFCRNIFSYLLFSAVPILLMVIIIYIMPYLSEPSQNGSNHTRAFFTYYPATYSDSVTLYSSSPASGLLSNAFNEFLKRQNLKTLKVDNVTAEIRKIYYEDFQKYAREIIMGVEFHSEYNRVDIHYNAYAIRILPVSINVLYNTFLLSRNDKSSIITSVNLSNSYWEDYDVRQIYEAEMPKVKCSVEDLVSFVGVQAVYYLRGPVQEKRFGAKHLQLMTTSSFIYWLSHLIHDFITFAIYLAIILIVVGFSTSDDVITKNMGDIIFGFFLMGIALILITYLLSMITKNLAASTSIFLSIYFVFSLLVYSFVRWGIWPQWVQYMHPSSILKMGLSDICYGIEDYFKTALTAYNIILFVIIVLFDSQITSSIVHWLLTITFKVKYPTLSGKHPAVKEHEKYVSDMLRNNEFSLNSLIVTGIKRWYMNRFRPRPAVRGLSFAVNSGECFGLLGVNGAGKTTTFKILTGEVSASEGEAYVNGYRLFSPFQGMKALYEIGYCPQYSGIIPSFKGKELITLFARLRGCYGSFMRSETERLITELGLSEHFNTYVENYSGGNQRKLAIGQAIVGNTSVVFLDEPTSGVDPISRRQIWDIIGNLRQDGKSVVLTSHSMDECEAVCTKLAIMVKGTFRCYGEVTTLKESFGQGFTVILKIHPDSMQEELDAIKSAMSTRFGPNCDLIDEHLTVLEYHITNKALKWAELFSNLLEMKKKSANLESFHASATTLEQIFIYFARNQ